MGITATNISNVEMQILRNAIIGKQHFYITEGGISEVAADVDFAGLPDRPSSSQRKSCGDADTYSIKNTSTPIILTLTEYSPSESSPKYDLPADESTKKQVIENVTDTKWPVNYAGLNNEYAFRVYYKGEGPKPKGYGKDFTSYIFDLTTRKQSGATKASMSTIINEGFRKIGPKT
jgi:hypothetical protein